MDRSTRSRSARDRRALARLPSVLDPAFGSLDSEAVQAVQPGIDGENCSSTDPNRCISASRRPCFPLAPAAAIAADQLAAQHPSSTSVLEGLDAREQQIEPVSCLGIVHGAEIVARDQTP